MIGSDELNLVIQDDDNSNSPPNLSFDIEKSIIAGGVLVIKENGDHIGTIRTEVRTANCAFDENFQYLYMTSDMFLTRIKLL